MAEILGKFTDIKLHGRPFRRLARALYEIEKRYSDVTYDEKLAIAHIPSQGLTITFPSSFPFKSPFFAAGGVTYVVPNFNVGINLATLIPAFIDNRSKDFEVYIPPITVTIQFFTNGNLIRYDNVIIEPRDMTIKDFVDDQLPRYFNASANNVYSINTAQKKVYSVFGDFDNKKLRDADLNDHILNVTTHSMLSEQNIVDYMVSSVTLNLSKKKIVSTPNSGQAPGIIRYHLELYEDNLDTILERVFKMTGVRTKYGSYISRVTFYLETPLNIFAAELRKTVEEFESVENLPDLLLTTLSDIMSPSTEPYYSIMLVLFGNISGEAPQSIIPPDYTPDARVMAAYKEYEKIVDQ